MADRYRATGGEIYTPPNPHVLIRGIGAHVHPIDSQIIGLLRVYLDRQCVHPSGFDIFGDIKLINPEWPYDTFRIRDLAPVHPYICPIIDPLKVQPYLLSSVVDGSLELRAVPPGNSERTLR